MKISFADYIKKVDVSVLVAQAIFNQLTNEFPLVPISELAETTSGGTPSRSNSNYYNGNIPWMKSGELNDGLISEIEESITEQGLTNSSAKVYPKGTLVIALYGATAGKVGILNLEAASNQAVCAVFPNEKADRDFLFWFLRQHRFHFIEISKGGAQPNISQTVVNKTEVPLPPLGFQRSIASFLKKTEQEGKLNFELIPEQYVPSVQQLFSIKNTYETLLSELTHQQTLLARLRQSILQEAVQGQLTAAWRQANPDVEPASELLRRIRAEKAAGGKKEKPLPPVIEQEKPFELPEGWVWCRLEELCTEIVDCPHSTPKYLESETGFYGIDTTCINAKGEIVRLRNVSKDTYEERILRLVPKEGDIVYSREGSIGQSVILPKGLKACLGQRVMLFRLPLFITSTFLKIILDTDFYLNQILKNHKGMGAKHVNVKDIRLSIIPLPPLPEQAAIVARVEALLERVSALEAESARQRAWAEGLLQAALREAMGG